MAQPQSPTPVDESYEQRPSRNAKRVAMENAQWLGAARQGRKRPSSTSPPHGSRSAKSTKKSKSAAKTNLAAQKKRAKTREKVPEPQAISKKPGSMGAGGNKPAHRQKVSRKPPVTIISGDEDEVPSESSLLDTDHRNRKNRTQETDDESTQNGSSEESQSDEEDFDDGAEGLQGLDDRSLISTLRSERAHWSSKPPDEVIPDVELTTASEVDGRPAEDEEDAFSEEDENKDQKIARRRSYKVSKREDARRAEVPRFSQATHSKNTHPKKGAKPLVVESEGSSNNDSSMSRSRSNKCRDPIASLTLPAPGARMISIRAQAPEIQTVIKAAIRKITGDALFLTAYPSAITLAAYLRDTLATTAKDLKLSSLSLRFQGDHKFGESISRVLTVRLSTLRCNLKKAAAAEVKGFYAFGTGDACRQRIEVLMKAKEYIYPRSHADVPWRSRPFQHPCILSILKEFVFSSSRGMSLAEKHAHRFKSSIQEGSEATELEVPIAMVCAAATAVHAALDDWSDGKYKKTTFVADFYEGVYKWHEEYLEAIREASIAKFHRLMATIYSAVSISNVNQAADAVAGSSAMALLDIDEMEV